MKACWFTNRGPCKCRIRYPARRPQLSHNPISRILKLEALAPDVIVTRDHCEVCAVSLKDVEQAVCTRVQHAATIVSLKPDTVADIWNGIEEVASALGLESEGARVVAALKARMQAIADRTATARTRPCVALIEWIEPLMAGGNWMPELVRSAGGHGLFAEAGKHSPWLDWEEIVAADPDVIVAHPCGFDIARTLQDMPLLARRAGWRDLKAVRAARVFVADGNQYFNRPGPRIVESLEILAEILHPELFPPRYEGEAWMHYASEATIVNEARA